MAVKINFDVTNEQLKTLKNAFPEIEPELCANEISKYATEELIELLSGKKRYLSLVILILKFEKQGLIF